MVSFTLQGTARPAIDYVVPPLTATFAAGSPTARVEVTLATPADAIPSTRTLTLNLNSSGTYNLGNDTSATINLIYEAGGLYVASLRIPDFSTGSTASGSASLQMSPDGTSGIVNVNFFGLSSPQTVAYIRLGDKNQVGIELVRLPNGQVTALQWTLRASGNLSIADIQTALRDGRVFVSVQTELLPTGELVGSFVRSTGSTAFVPPDAPPALPLSPLSATDAARFLAQATFGPTQADIDSLTGQAPAVLNTWITGQFNAPVSSHRSETQADFDNFVRTPDKTTVGTSSRHYAWWKIAVKGQDQLRQRVAFALSQILVVSEVNDTIAGEPLNLAGYQDMLAQHAFGNYRTLLEQVSLSPIMGVYLSHLRNNKGTFNAQGVPLTYPDENYAREVMQLFSVGLNLLHPDGSLILDSAGSPIPVYDQQTIAETAKVFTGWGFASASANPSFFGAAKDYSQPMRLYPNNHDNTAKTILGGRVLPANQGGLQDLKDTLDTLFNHPNTGPFICRQLIQRLVTSNPSPGYIYRVARVFADNGSGVRGDLGAVVRAILLDYEARSTAEATSVDFGKLREPVLRATAMLRALGGESNSGRFPISAGNTDNNLGQTALRSPTVFNFFIPGYIQPGQLARAGLVAPEFQILTDTTGITIPNFLRGYLYANRPAATDTASQTIGLRPDAATLALTQTPSALIARLNLLLTSGSMSAYEANQLAAAIDRMPAATSDANRLERYRSAVYVMLTTPRGAVQK